MLRSPHWTGYSPFPAPTKRGEVQFHSGTVRHEMPVRKKDSRFDDERKRFLLPIVRVAPLGDFVIRID
jgi:hypothetical protein